jgi:hypothetical protein
VYEIVESDDAAVEGQQKLRYYIDTAAEYRFPLWPFNGTQTIAIHDAFTDHDEILHRRAKPKLKIRFHHSMLGRHMCSVGSIRTSTKTKSTKDATTGEKSTEPSKSEQNSVSDSVSGLDEQQAADLFLGSGLGHGEWRDEVTEKILGLYDDSKPHVWQPKIAWNATDTWSSTLLENGSPQTRKVEGGGLLLRGPKSVNLAWYKPRPARWIDRGVYGDGKGVGVLGFSAEAQKLGFDEGMVRHVLLSAVAVEEQIMGSAGFEPGKYHAGWY